MENLIQLNTYPTNAVLDILLQDKTTKKNIIWATDTYASLGSSYQDTCQITSELLLGLSACVIQPRILKDLEQQVERTRKKAEVFTPAWICNKMNNYCDEQWFGYKDVFNIEQGQDWAVFAGKIRFPETLTWQNYVDSRRLEITCGEAPYLVSRYNAATGEMIPVKRRIGILDRKLRVIGENTDAEEEWIKWTIRAFQSVYGYEYQGDNLLIARINLLLTFSDYMEDRWQRKPDKKELRKIANIISWNLWQMDGLKGTVPLGVPREEYYQMSLFETEPEKPKGEPEVFCKIFDWRLKDSLLYKSLRKVG